MGGLNWESSRSGKEGVLLHEADRSQRCKERACGQEAEVGSPLTVLFQWCLMCVCACVLVGRGLSSHTRAW